MVGLGGYQQLGSPTLTSVVLQTRQIGYGDTPAKVDECKVNVQLSNKDKN